jgi:hypothetical protein
MIKKAHIEGEGAEYYIYLGFHLLKPADLEAYQRTHNRSVIYPS